MGEEDEVMAVEISKDSLVSKGEMVRRCSGGRARAIWGGGHEEYEPANGPESN